VSLGGDARTARAVEEFLRYKEEEKDLSRRYALADQGLWVQKDSSTIAIKNMTSQHIKNSFNMLCRNMPRYTDELALLAKRYLDLFEAELKARYQFDDLVPGGDNW